MASPHTDEEWLLQLESPEAAVVVSALHAACPCQGETERRRYEEFMAVVARFKKDPRPDVRKVALHLERDAFEQLAEDDERANGFQRGTAASRRRGRELRRSRLRQGF